MIHPGIAAGVIKVGPISGENYRFIWIASAIISSAVVMIREEAE